MGFILKLKDFLEPDNSDGSSTLVRRTYFLRETHYFSNFFHHNDTGLDFE